jgi:hypothetical protein
MPTDAQIRAESWWKREIVTSELDWLGDELCRRTGQPRTAAGTKGNEAHRRGGHRSQEWIEKSAYCTNRTYTVQSGLTAEQERHVAALDFTPGQWGTQANRRLMQQQTRRLVDALKSGRLAGVREVIGTLDGRTVTAIRPDGSTFSADTSHLDHWHLTLDRRRCRDKKLMERIIAVALGDEGDEVALTAEDLAKIEEAARKGVLDAYLGRDGNRKKVSELIALAGGYAQQIDGTTIRTDATATRTEQAVGRIELALTELPRAVASGLGGGDLDEAAEALRAALGRDRATELGRLLASG